MKSYLVLFPFLVFTIAPCSSFNLAGLTLSTRPHATRQYLTMCEAREQVVKSRRDALFSIAGFLAGSYIAPFSVGAEEAKVDTPVAPVCNNILGCPIEGELKPPPRKFKSILEEEQELARQQAETARKSRQEAFDQEIKVARGQFAVIKKGKKDLEKDVTEVLAAAEANLDDKKAWDDLR
jgi:hypothetical protein